MDCQAAVKVTLHKCLPCPATLGTRAHISGNSAAGICGTLWTGNVFRVGSQSFGMQRWMMHGGTKTPRILPSHCNQPEWLALWPTGQVWPGRILQKASWLLALSRVTAYPAPVPSEHRRRLVWMRCSLRLVMAERTQHVFFYP